MIDARAMIVAGGLASCLALFGSLPAQEPAVDASESAVDSAPRSASEARGRASLLHETIHGVLQVMHRDFFDEDNASDIPSASLEDVFHELERSHGVKVKWLIVDTDVVNVDHQPESAIERKAVKALKAGDPNFEAITNGRYHFVGSIRLASQCLKCHVKRRTSTHDRKAGLSISMPLHRKSGS